MRSSRATIMPEDTGKGFANGFQPDLRPVKRP